MLEAADPSQRFQRILLNSSMWNDHLASTYLAALQQVVADLQQPAEREPPCKP